MTLVRCVLHPGQENTSCQLHPNCEEIVELLEGAIIHTWNDQEVVMDRGNVLSIPPGVAHNTRNVGAQAAELLICFSSSTREAKLLT